MKTIVLFFAIFLIALCSSSIAELKSTFNKADYIIIGPASFENSMQTFNSWRTQKGLTVKFCSTEDIYLEFNGSESKQEAIRSFVNYAFENWQSPKVRFMLLAGGINLIPSYTIKSNYSNQGEDSISSDRLFGVKGSDMTSAPSVVAGRIPARTEQELIDFINKTMQFENNFSFSDYSNNATFLIESRKQDGDLFIQVADAIQKAYFDISKTKFIKTKSDTVDPQIKIDLINSINNGTLFLCNIMQANAFHWGYSGIFTDSGIDNTELPGPPIIFTAYASTQNCYSLESKSLLEQLLIKGSNGAVASFTPSGINYVSTLERVINEFFTNLINLRVKTLGEAVQNIPGSNLFVYHGDPALQNPYYTIAGIKDNQNSQDEIEVFPNPVIDKLVVMFKSPTDEISRIEIYDLLGNRLSDFGNIIPNTNNQKMIFNMENFQTGVYLLKIQTSQRTVFKQIIKSN